jgi:hypothetical protein
MRLLLQSFLMLIFMILTSAEGRGQRQYISNSVLSTGAWYKISIFSRGVYRVDASMLSRVGLSLPVPSAQIRLFGNGGQMLPEQNAGPRQDDLKENAIWVDDGGDGNFAGNDYFLFYAPGPDTWEFDTQTSRYRHQNNLYADSAWYYITVGGTG